MGSATSAFQAHPRWHIGECCQTCSDWEFELNKALNGKSKKIHDLHAAPLPRFFDKKELYLERSAELGENMFRFSLDMGRLCPGPGEFDEEHMAESIKVLALIRAQKQEPMLTVNHFTMPRFLTSINQNGKIVAGAWEHPDVIKHIRFYIEHVADFLADKKKIQKILEEEGYSKDLQDRLIAEGLVKYFMSINEPFTILENGYFFGVFPPYKGLLGALSKKRRKRMGYILRTMVNAHDIIYDTLKSFGEASDISSKRCPQVGVGYNWNYTDGLGGSLFHKKVDRKITNAFERGGLHSDFLALQYYFRLTIPFLGPLHIPWRDYSDHRFFGNIYPEGLLEMLKRMHAAYPDKKIFITELGFADAKDKRRPYWILESMRNVFAAQRAGVPVESVLLWSLVDNFEWDNGMSLKFGLFTERSLCRTLIPESGRIRSWEAWEAAIRYALAPTDDSKKMFDECHTRAKAQHDAW